jgi:hypothetical protein
MKKFVSIKLKESYDKLCKIIFKSLKNTNKLYIISLFLNILYKSSKISSLYLII